MKQIVALVLGLAIIAGLVGAVTWVVSSFFSYLSVIPKELAASLVAAAATIIVATVTVVVGRYFERKRELDALYREKKTEIYDEFLREFFSLQFSAGSADSQTTDKDLVPFLRDFMRKLVLWSGPEVIEAFVVWKEHLKKGTPDARSMFLTEDFLRAIRADLRQSNRKLRRGFYPQLILKEGALFLAMAKKNPNLTLDELAQVESLLERGKAGAGDA